jgi:hypothetical protein
MIKSLSVFCRGYSLTKRPGVRDWNDFLGIEYELRKFQQQATSRADRPLFGQALEYYTEQNPGNRRWGLLECLE